MKILVVDDEKLLVKGIKYNLEQEGYMVETAFDGEEAVRLAHDDSIDLILLDLMLPKMDGISVLSEIRRNNINTPVLMLTARSEIEDKITGLDNGADDYLTKPFNSKELHARIRALLRRKEKTFIDSNLKFADIVLNKSTHEICKNNQKVKLTKKEYNVMEFLILNQGKVVSKESLTVKIWGYDTDIEYNSIEVYISFLRKKLSAVDSDIHIATVRGLGYTIKEHKNV